MLLSGILAKYNTGLGKICLQKGPPWIFWCFDGIVMIRITVFQQQSLSRYK